MKSNLYNEFKARRIEKALEKVAILLLCLGILYFLAHY